MNKNYLTIDDEGHDKSLNVNSKKIKENAGLESALYKFTEQILTRLGWSELKRVGNVPQRVGEHGPPWTGLWSGGQMEMEIHPSVLPTMSRSVWEPTYLCAQLFQLDAPASPSQASKCVLKTRCVFMDF